MRLLTLLPLIALPSLAHAYTCDVLILDDGHNDAIVGEWLQPVVLPISWPPTVAYIPTGQSAVCWTDDSGVEHLQLISSCNRYTPAGDGFQIEGRDGDDWIAVLEDAHLGGAFEYTCGGRPDVDGKLGAWRSDFSFDLYLLGGEGSDVLVGGPNNDLLLSNDLSSAADQSGDLMCGQDGDDWMLGDLDDTTFGIEEFCDGGAGTDTCAGDFYTGGSSNIDVSSNVTTWTETWNGVTTGSWSPAVMCAGIDDPVNEWDAAREWRTF